jgi:hypothetical protein
MGGRVEVGGSEERQARIDEFQDRFSRTFVARTWESPGSPGVRAQEARWIVWALCRQLWATKGHNLIKTYVLN